VYCAACCVMHVCMCVTGRRCCDGRMTAFCSIITKAELTRPNTFNDSSFYASKGNISDDFAWWSVEGSTLPKMFQVRVPTCRCPACDCPSAVVLSLLSLLSLSLSAAPSRGPLLASSVVFLRRVWTQYFTPDTARAAGGTQVRTSGSNYALDFVPTYSARRNCQVSTDPVVCPSVSAVCITLWFGLVTGCWGHARAVRRLRHGHHRQQLHQCDVVCVVGVVAGRRWSVLLQGETACWSEFRVTFDSTSLICMMDASHCGGRRV
jgi:hypothetical protein